ncbi:MAG: hypothetical protein U9N10_01235 [Bacillota bacterium]|nr:hypothetical protein [Bacillota bacterium]
MKRSSIVIVVLISILIIGPHVLNVIFPKQLEHTIEKYFDDRLGINKSKYLVYDSEKWMGGELVAIENDEMVGIIYLKNYFGLYVVENHALCNKKDESKSDYMPSDDYQYRLLRVKSFANNSDILIAYINDSNIKSMTLENEFQVLEFQLTDNRKLIFSETQQLLSIVKTQTDIVEKIVIEWKDKTLQDFMKYDIGKLVLGSKVPLDIAVIGNFGFKTDNNIQLDNIELRDIDELNSETYDALFVNTRISNEKVDDLVKKNWDVYVIAPLNNLEKPNNNINENVIIIEGSNRGGGRSSKGNFYDLKTNYYSAFNHIFDRLSDRKE